MVTLVNRAKMSTSTTGTGAITLGSAESGYQSFADAGVSDGDVVRYVIEDGSDWEIGSGTYTASGTTLTRTISESSNADAAIVLTGSATVFIGATAEDIYTDADVDTHLNKSTATTGEVLSWSGTDYDWIAAGGGGSPDLYRDNAVSATTPVAGGNNSFSIGSGSSTTGADGVAIGTLAKGLNSHAKTVAIGHTAQVNTANGVAIGVNTLTYGGSGGTSIGYDARNASQWGTSIGTNSSGNGSRTATGNGATALGGSYASGTDSFAAAISNNTSSYGATAQGATVIGNTSKGTAERAVSIGQANIASGANSTAIGYLNTSGSTSYTTAIGYYNTASAAWAMALGNSSTASHSKSVSIGDSVSSTAANQVNIGGSTQTVRISEAYTLPTADGTANQVLTTDGSGAVTFADAGGGGGSPDLYSDSANGSAVTPTSNAGGSYNSVAIGNGADIGSGRGESIAIGTDSLTNQSQAIALGKAATVGSGGSFATALGRNSLANGTSATAIGTSYASGTDSFAAAIANNSSSYGATNTSSIAIGKQAKTTGAYGTAIGEATQATASNSVCMGYYSQATAQGAVAIGYDAQATAGKSYSFGLKVRNAIQNTFRFAGGHFSAAGDAQSGIYIMRSDTTDATAEALTTTKTTASTDNQVILPNNSAYFFSGTIIAREQASAGTDVGAWEIKGAIRREANAASTVLIKSTIDDFNVPTGWAVALTADTTNGGLAITVTGAAATNIRWVATVNTSEVTY